MVWTILNKRLNISRRCVLLLIINTARDMNPRRYGPRNANLSQLLLDMFITVPSHICIHVEIANPGLLLMPFAGPILNHHIKVATSMYMGDTGASYPPASCVVRKDLVRHDHEPKEEDGSDESEGEDSLP